MAEKRYAILIASSSFPEEPGLTALRCPEHDVDALNEILSSPEHGHFTETFVFKNKPSHEVLEQIETVLHDAGREDLVLIYFSGHGKLNPAGQLCLATANTKLKALGSTSIPVERIKSFFDAADTRKKILILDCCYSGAAGAEFVKGGVDDQLQLMSGGQGTFIMTASTGFQVAVEKEGDQLGLFTKHLVEGIRSGEADRDEDGLVDIHELYQHVYENVRAEGAQEPMKWDINAKGRMIVAKSDRGAKEKPLIDDTIVKEAARPLSIQQHRITGEADTGSPKPLSEQAWQKEPPPVAEVPASSRQKDNVVIWPWITIALCVGAGWYFISVSRQTVPSLPQIKLQPLPKAERMPKKGRTIGQYIDHGDGTVTDTQTGLMWKRCLEGLSGVNCENGKKEEYKWNDAVKRFKDVKYAGYVDWRLPTIDELKTLAHCGNNDVVRNEIGGSCNKGSEQSAIDSLAFPNAESSYIWSGSPYAGYSGSAWYLISTHHYSYNFSLSLSCAVRLVRGGQ